MTQDCAKVAELFGRDCDANTDKETALYRNKRLHKGSTVFKKACEPGDYRMRCFGVLYLRNEGFACRAEAIKLLAGAARRYGPSAATRQPRSAQKNISQAKNAVIARVNCYHEALRGESMRVRQKKRPPRARKQEL